MTVQLRIPMITNKISRSFILHENRETKDTKICFINILDSSLRRFEIEYVLRKKTEISVKQIFTFFAFVFHLKRCYWFYYCGFIILLL